MPDHIGLVRGTQALRGLTYARKRTSQLALFPRHPIYGKLDTRRTAIDGENPHSPPSPHLTFHFLQPVRTLQYIPRFAAIRRPDNPFALHHVQYPRRAPVTQPQPPLQRRRGSLPHLQHHPDRVLIHWVLLALHLLGLTFLFFGGRSKQERLIVFRPRLPLPEFHHQIGFHLRHEGSVHAHQPRRTGRKKQHVALA